MRAFFLVLVVRFPNTCQFSIPPVLQVTLGLSSAELSGYLTKQGREVGHFTHYTLTLRNIYSIFFAMFTKLCGEDTLANFYQRLYNILYTVPLSAIPSYVNNNFHLLCFDLLCSLLLCLFACMFFLLLSSIVPAVALNLFCVYMSDVYFIYNFTG